MFDVLIAGGDVYDGSGGGPVPADVGVCGDRVAAVGCGLPREAGAVVDAAGKAVCPGFINILSHSNLSILQDPRSLGELTQGVTTEVFGEGVSMGPLTPRLKAELERTSRGLDVEWQGRTLAEVAAAQGSDPVETAMDLIASDRSRIQVAFFSMSEENLRAALRRPWVSISSDGTSMAPEGAFLRAPTHPRAYGSFARVLGHYARDEKLLPLADAIHRMSGQPAATLGLSGRGVLREGACADIVVFDPATVMDRATFGNPHQLSAGVSEVLVNGKVTISGGAFTGQLAGRALAGPGTRR